jgi:hypothetical protein
MRAVSFTARTRNYKLGVVPMTVYDVHSTIISLATVHCPLPPKYGGGRGAKRITTMHGCQLPTVIPV